MLSSAQAPMWTWGLAVSDAGCLSFSFLSCLSPAAWSWTQLSATDSTELCDSLSWEWIDDDTLRAPGRPSVPPGFSAPVQFSWPRFYTPRDRFLMSQCDDHGRSWKLSETRIFHAWASCHSLAGAATQLEDFPGAPASCGHWWWHHQDMVCTWVCHSTVFPWFFEKMRGWGDAVWQSVILIEAPLCVYRRVFLGVCLEFHLIVGMREVNFGENHPS